jgi:hypothetical protein
MPPVNQGSRGALITWLVAVTVAGVAAIIVAIYFYVENNRVTTEAATLQSKYKDVVAEAALSSSELGDLKAWKEANGKPNMSLMDAALAQRDDLAHLAAGSGATADKATTAARNTVKTAAERAKAAGVANLPGDNLTATVDALAGALQSRQQEVANLTEQLNQANKKAQDAIAQMEANRKQLDAGLAAARSDAEAAQTAAGSDRASKDQQLALLSQNSEAAQKQQQQTMEQMQVTNADLTKKLNDANAAIEGLRIKLGERRLPSEEPIIRQADGQIIRVAGNGTVYINLGSGDQISPGLTFEVYDRAEGVPAIGKDPMSEENLPKGKGSIEVTRVGPGSSECKITKLQPGQNIFEGDVIANVVYDRSVKNNFLVYGNFDLDQNGVATPGDAEVIKQLVTKWGGKLTDKITADTDFVVLGKEPQIPNYTKDELQDPINAARENEARQAAEAYDNVKNQALTFHIPILNQNRFLYFVGYYDQAKQVAIPGAQAENAAAAAAAAGSTRRQQQ